MKVAMTMIMKIKMIMHKMKVAMTVVMQIKMIMHERKVAMPMRRDADG